MSSKTISEISKMSDSEISKNLLQYDSDSVIISALKKIALSIFYANNDLLSEDEINQVEDILSIDSIFDIVNFFDEDEEEEDESDEESDEEEDENEVFEKIVAIRGIDLFTEIKIPNLGKTIVMFGETHLCDYGEKKPSHVDINELLINFEQGSRKCYDLFIEDHVERLKKPPIASSLDETLDDIKGYGDYSPMVLTRDQFTEFIVGNKRYTPSLRMRYHLVDVRKSEDNKSLFSLYANLSAKVDKENKLKDVLLKLEVVNYLKDNIDELINYITGFDKTKNSLLVYKNFIEIFNGDVDFNIKHLDEIHALFDKEKSKIENFKRGRFERVFRKAIKENPFSLVLTILQDIYTFLRLSVTFDSDKQENTPFLCKKVENLTPKNIIIYAGSAHIRFMEKVLTGYYNVHETDVRTINAKEKIIHFDEPYDLLE